MSTEKKEDRAANGNGQNPRKEYIKILHSMSTRTQNYQVLNHLLRYGTLTSMEAIQAYSITRLSGRVYDLRNTYGIDVRGRVKGAKNGIGKKVYFSEYYLGGLF